MFGHILQLISDRIGLSSDPFVRKRAFLIVSQAGRGFPLGRNVTAVTPPLGHYYVPAAAA